MKSSSGLLSDQNPFQLEIDQLNSEADQCILSAKNEAIELCLKAIALGAPDGIEFPIYPGGVGTALQNMGRIYMARTEYGRALDYFNEALKVFESFKIRRSIILCRSYMAINLFYLGDYVRALEILVRAAKEAQDINDGMLEAEIKNDLGYAYVHTGQVEMAIPILEESLGKFREMNDKTRLGWTLDSLANAYLTHGEPDKALQYAEESLRICETNENWNDYARSLPTLIKIYQAKGENEKVVETSLHLLDLSRQYHLPSAEFSAIKILAQAKIQEGHLEEALSLLKHALDLAIKNEIKPEIKDFYYLLTQVYKKKGDYQSALEYFERFYELEKVLFNSETDQRLKNLQVLYQVEAARREVEHHKGRVRILQQEVEESKKVQSKLEFLATIDPLTGMLNRRAFFELGEEAFNRALEEQSHLAVILIDLDHFKEINDRYGHPVGDQVLMLISERIQASLHEDDPLGRYGGEEFVILLEKNSLVCAMEIAERLRKAISDQPFQVGDHKVRVTLSLGVADMNSGETMVAFNQLVERADHALYHAKAKGRNCAVSYNPNQYLSFPN